MTTTPLGCQAGLFFALLFSFLLLFGVSSMRIIPVIDLKSGVVVRGVAGQRDEYRPVQSVLTSDPSPLSVAVAFQRQFGFNEIYLADLDAIAGADPDYDAYTILMSSGANLWIDAGIDCTSRAKQLAEFRAAGRTISGVIAGLESLPEPTLLGEFVKIVGPQRLIFSLDLKAGRPLTQIDVWKDAKPERIAAEAIRLGVRRMIVLDLAQVGMGQGAALMPLCARIRSLDPSVELITGGGVRHRSDVETLTASACNSVLVASALHDGGITPEDVGELGNQA